MTKFENYQILLYKLSHRFQATTKLISGRKSLIVTIDIWAFTLVKGLSQRLVLHVRTIWHNMENLMVIRVEVIAPEKPLLSKHLQK